MKHQKPREFRTGEMCLKSGVTLSAYKADEADAQKGQSAHIVLLVLRQFVRAYTIDEAQAWLGNALHPTSR
jgi:hypothetical protein